MIQALSGEKKQEMEGWRLGCEVTTLACSLSPGEMQETEAIWSFGQFPSTMNLILKI
jgi:hypothetical protein